jgi:predicted HicB family RNase H-like nuclease
MARKKKAERGPRSSAADRIHGALHPGGISPRAKTVKNTNINIRVTPAQKEEIAEIAQQLGVSVTDYFIELHNQAKAILVDRDIP